MLQGFRLPSEFEVPGIHFGLKPVIVSMEHQSHHPGVYVWLAWLQTLLSLKRFDMYLLLFLKSYFVI